MAHDMDITVNNLINVLLGKKPNVLKDKLKDWRFKIGEIRQRKCLILQREKLYSQRQQFTEGHFMNVS